MKELFLPYELALVAKEKGLDCDCCLATYDMVGVLHITTRLFKGETIAPLYQQAVDWFRETHHILITITAGGKSATDWSYYHGDVESLKKPRVKINWEGDDTKFRGAMPIKNLSYYEALNKAISEAFKLI